MVFWSFFSIVLLLIRSWSNKPLGSIPNPKTVIVYHIIPTYPPTQAYILKQSHTLGSSSASPFLFSLQVKPSSDQQVFGLLPVSAFIQRNILVSFPTFQTRNSDFNIVYTFVLFLFCDILIFDLKQLYLWLYILSFLSHSCVFGAERLYWDVRLPVSSYWEVLILLKEDSVCASGGFF